MLNEPVTIGAICVSHSSRWGLLQRAIVNFLEQEYSERRLWIVVKEPGYAEQIRTFLNDRRLLNSVEVVPSEFVEVRLVDFQTPTEAFVLALGWAWCDWIACWDDDNLSHPDRFNFQLNRAGPHGPCLLAQSLYYFYDSDELFVTDYAQPAGQPHERCALGSLLFPRAALPVLDVRAGGPWSIQVLTKMGMEYDLIGDCAGYFLAGSNGDNYRGEELHRRLGSKLPGTLTRAQLCQESKAEEVEGWLSFYRFPSTAVDVCGKDLQAFRAEQQRMWPDWLATTAYPEDYKLWLPSSRQKTAAKLAAAHEKKLRQEAAAAEKK